MKKRSIISVVVVAVSLSLLYGNISYAGRQWNRFHRSSRDKSSSFLNLSLSTKEIVKKEMERFFKE